MIVENPEVTLEDEAGGFPKEATDRTFFHWGFMLNVHGDDGRQYWIDGNIASYKSLGSFAAVPWGATDMWTLAVRWEKGKVVQLPGSVYKIADFPQLASMSWHPFPVGALKIKRAKDKVAVDLEDFHLICKDDKTWHFSVEDKEKGVKAEWVQDGVGFPCWYGKEKPEAFTPHAINYGYYWAGAVEGTLTIEGRKVRIKGKGVREVYRGVDSCMAEVGGWMDWIWFHFDEMFGCMDEHKLTKHKEMSLYLVREKQFFPVGSFNIEHHDWAYLGALGAFIPTRYKVTIETEAGVLEMTTNVVGFKFMASSGEVPDVAFASLDWDKLNGTFTYKDGRKIALTNGLGGTQIAEWKPYPNILAPLASTDIAQAAVLPTIE